jgi:hypothetical protein
MAGSSLVGVRFSNDFYDPANMADRNVFVDWIDLARAGTPLDPANALVRICEPALLGEEPCARKIFQSFARRAYRRPASDAELARLLSFLPKAQSQGDGFNEAMKAGLTAILLSPHFLFRVELDPDPAAPTSHPLTDHELATRLSYFLWSTTPDAELSTLADQGTLGQDDVLQGQVKRLLADPRSEAVVQNFAGQWLQTRAVSSLAPAPSLFPDFDAPLQDALQRETQLFFRTFLEEDRSFLEILTSDYTFLNDRLARHYGIASPGSGAQMTRVTLAPGSHRGGLLTQGSVLAVTSLPNRTSPPKRGKWVMGQLLCADPPPPPANVATDLAAVPIQGSARDKLKAHRDNPACGGCHALFDPVGLGLENYDAVGAYRTVDSEKDIDPAGIFVDGTPFAGVSELEALLAQDPRLPRCAVQKLYTYALGSGEVEKHSCLLDSATERFAGSGHRLRELVRQIVLSPTFRSRAGETP